MQVETDDMVLFWQNDSIYSNWYPAQFEYDNCVFENSEACFMYLKALCFKDQKIAKEILESQDPREVKFLGRKIRNFDEKKWEQDRERAMYMACLSKFIQNPEFAKALDETGDKIIVEASPLDKIWGIGLAPDDTKALDKSNWQGLNLLGEVLMKVRTTLRNRSIV